MDFYSSGEQRCPHAVLIHMGISNRTGCLLLPFYTGEMGQKRKPGDLDRIKAELWSWRAGELQQSVSKLAVLGSTWVYAEQHQIITVFATPS